MIADPGHAVPHEKTLLVWLYERMLLIREFEEKVYQLRASGALQGSAHLYVGQEAVAVGVCAHLQPDDYITSTHRGHGHCIAKGVDVKRMMAELYGRTNGTNQGKGGSMHIADVSKGMLGTTAVVGSGYPLALGAALSAKVRGTDQVSVCFFGDGATAQGTLHECMNMASIWKLPLLFVCENNGYGQSTPAEYALCIRDIAERAPSYNMPGRVVDGMDVFQVYQATREAVERARRGEGPAFLEFKTYRYYGHFFGDDPLRYRTKEEEDAYRARDPLTGFERRSLDEGWLSEVDLQEVRARVAGQIEEAVAFAEAGAPPKPSDLEKDVYTGAGG